MGDLLIGVSVLCQLGVDPKSLLEDRRDLLDGSNCSMVKPTDGKDESTDSALPVWTRSRTRQSLMMRALTGRTIHLQNYHPSCLEPVSEGLPLIITSSRKEKTHFIEHQFLIQYTKTKIMLSKSAFTIRLTYPVVPDFRNQTRETLGSTDNTHDCLLYIFLIGAPANI